MQSHISRDERLALIENILFHNAEGVRAVELAEKCGVDRRTIYRDMVKLRKDGLPLYKKHGRFYVSREYYHAPVQLTLNEIVALFTAVRVLSHIGETHNPHMISALTKLCEGLPEAMANHVEEVGAILRQKPVDRLFVRVIEAVVHAWGAKRWVRIWTKKEQDAIEIAPHFLEANGNGVLYVVGVEAGTGAVRAFRVNQILRIETLKRTFQLTVFPDVQAYLADFMGNVGENSVGLQDVRLVFSADAASKVLSEQMSVMVDVDKLPDGRLSVHLRVKDWHDLMDWVLRRGSQVEVLAPQSFREAVADEVQRLAAMYTTSRTK